MRYKLLYSVDPGSITKEVNEYLKIGYKLYGNPFYNSSKGFYCQAVSKQTYLTNEKGDQICLKQIPNIEYIRSRMN